MRVTKFKLNNKLFTLNKEDKYRNLSEEQANQMQEKGTFAEKAFYNINKQYHREVENFAPQILSSLAISLLPDEILDNTEFGKSVKKHSRDVDEFDTLHYEGSAFELGYFDKGKYYQMKDSKGKDITVEIE